MSVKNVSISVQISRGILWLSFVAFLFMGVQLAQSSLWHIADTLPDDAYYYVVPAFNFAKHGVISLDGVNVTNGFHPLWFLICSAIGYLVPSKEMLLRVAIIFSFTLFAIAPFVLSKLAVLRQSETRRNLFIAIALSLGTSRFIAAQVLEVGLYSLCLSLLAICLDRARENNWNFDRKNLIQFSAILTVATLTRLDCVLLGLIFFIGLSIYLRRPLMGLRQVWVPILALVIGIGAWSLFSLKTVGYVSQDSSTVKRMWIEFEKSQFGTLRLRNFKHGLNISLIKPLIKTFTSISVIAPLILCISFISFQKTKASEFISKYSFPIAFSITCCVQGVASRYFSADQLDWYMTPGFIGLLIWMAYVFGEIKLTDKAPRQFLVAATSLGVIGQYCYQFVKQPIYWSQGYYLEALQKAEAIMPPDATLAAWNSGVFAFHTNRKVTNLDGLVNHKMLDFYRTKTFDKAFGSLGIDYVLDWETKSKSGNEFFAKDRAEYFASKPFPLERIKSFDYGRTEFVLYKVIR